MTDLQRQLSATLERLLKESGIEFKAESFPVTKQYSSTPVPGEVYLRFDFSRNNRTYQVFLYSDEAGYFCDKHWIAFERGAFGNRDDLSGAFVEKVSAELGR